MLDHVNQYFPDILPENVLKHYGYDARPDGDLGPDALYQERTEDSVSNRSLLANAFESVAQNEVEKQKLQEYREKIALMDAEDQKLQDLNAQIKELSFAKGPRDTKKIRGLQLEAQQTANRIGIYDKQLLRLEASAPLQKVLEREKKSAYKRAEQKGKEALEAYRERAMKEQKELVAKWQESRKKGIESRRRAAIGKTGRRKGVVKGEGVTISDLKKTFNDTQGKAYKYLSTVAEVTGIDIVLYRSEAGPDGRYQGAQGRYSRSTPGTIYIDLNAGLSDIKSADDLAKYAMLRTFAHEFTHFIENWNPIQYNEFRTVVFDTLTQRGENVQDLIEDKQARNPGMSYDMASREVVAEAMTDILPDAHFVQELAENHKTIFQKLLDQLKEFVDNLRDYFNSIGHNPSREANALKEQVGDTIKYLDSIVQLFDKVAVQAVENYQQMVATENYTDGGITNGTERADQRTETLHRGGEESILEMGSGTQAETGNRSGISEASGARQEDITSGRQHRELGQAQKPFGKDDYVVPQNGSTLHNTQEAFKEYGIACHIIKASSWTRKAPAYACNGSVYISEQINEDTLSTAVPHETTHVMKQRGFKPYLEFIEKTPDFLNMKADEFRKLIKEVSQHRGVDIFDLDDTQLRNLYDELNSTVYGMFKGGILENSDYSYGEWVPGAFHDFEGYIRALDRIHAQYRRQYGTGKTATEKVANDSLDKGDLQYQSRSYLGEDAVEYVGLDLDDVSEIIKQGTGIKWNNGNNLKLPNSEYAAVKSRISTQYYRTASHGGVQFVDRSTDGRDAKFYLYLYVDHGFDNYEIIGRLDYSKQQDLILFLREAIQNGRKSEGVSAGTDRLRNFYERLGGGRNVNQDGGINEANVQNDSGSRGARREDNGRSGGADFGGYYEDGNGGQYQQRTDTLTDRDVQYQGRDYWDEHISVAKGMTDAERYEILKNRSISVTAKTRTDKLRSIEQRIGQRAEDAILLTETDRKKLFAKIGEEFGVFKGYSNANVKLTFIFSRGNLKESVGKQRKNYSDFAKMLSCFDEIIDSAIGIEVHNRNDEGYKYDPTLKNVYVLVSAFEDGSNIVPVKLEIKEFVDKDNTLYVAIALESIKKDEVVKQGNTKNGVTQNSRSSIINIADLFSKINPTDISFLKYIPTQFLLQTDEADQNQQRTDTLTDRDILGIAEQQGITKQLSAGQVSALQAFNRKNTEVGELLRQKAQQEMILRKQQAAAKPDKQEIIKTQNRIKTIEGQIRRESAKLRQYEAMDSVKGVLEKVKPVVEKKLLEERKKELAKYGTIPKGEKAVRESNLPTTTNGRNKVSRTARTVYEAEG